MASDENVNRNSCVYDPNFAIVCSFFEKFSSLCGIKHPPFSDLQQMLDSTDEISPELIDLHIRLMRKAKRNVNPDRWQRTLAKFCYLYHPQDSWDLEQHGYKKLDFKQRLKILLCICEAQFDHNIKFKTDINKLPIDELRLSPIGKDKDGIKYWIHTDEKLYLKVYKENPEEETFELIATDRAGLMDLIETLKLGRDPNRKYEEEPSEEEDDEDSEIGAEEEAEPEEAEKADDDDEDAEEEEEEEDNDDSSLKPSEPSTRPNTEEASKTAATTEPLPKQLSLKDSVSNELSTTDAVRKTGDGRSGVTPKVDLLIDTAPKKPHVDVKTKRFDKSPEITLKKEKVVDSTPKTLKPEEFAQHIEKLKSEKILLPLLSSPLPFPEPASGNASLKTKINMKFNMIKPVLTNEMLMSKIEEVKNNKDLYSYKKIVVKKEDNSISNYTLPVGKSKETPRMGKPGLKLEQILKSKLAQKLAASEASNVFENPSSTSAERSKPESEPAHGAQNTSAQPAQPPKAPEAVSASQNEPTKRKSSNDDEIPSKKLKIDETPAGNDDNGAEIEEPLMLVTGVGSGAQNQCVPTEENEREFTLFVTGTGSGVECNSPNEPEDEMNQRVLGCDVRQNLNVHDSANPSLGIDSRVDHQDADDDEDTDEREFCLFICGPGFGAECQTGNNEQTEEKDKPLTHKVENILSKAEADNDQGTSTCLNEETPKKVPPAGSEDSAEKKKPKLWTIDAICNSDSSKEAKKDDISCFPNYSFNKCDNKKPEISYRNEFSFFNMNREPKENDVMPTNFYFGCDTQNPPYVAEVRSTNNYKATKSHNVKDIVELDKDKETSSFQSYTNSHNEAFNLCTRPVTETQLDTGCSKSSENVYSNVMSLSTSNAANSQSEPNQKQNDVSTDAINDAKSSTESNQLVEDGQAKNDVSIETKHQEPVQTAVSVDSKDIPDGEALAKKSPLAENLTSEPAKESEPVVRTIDEKPIAEDLSPSKNHVPKSIDEDVESKPQILEKISEPVPEVIPGDPVDYSRNEQIEASQNKETIEKVEEKEEIKSQESEPVEKLDEHNISEEISSEVPKPVQEVYPDASSEEKVSEPQPVRKVSPESPKIQETIVELPKPPEISSEPPVSQEEPSTDPAKILETPLEISKLQETSPIPPSTQEPSTEPPQTSEIAAEPVAKPETSPKPQPVQEVCSKPEKITEASSESALLPAESVLVIPPIKEISPKETSISETPVEPQHIQEVPPEPQPVPETTAETSPEPVIAPESPPKQTEPVSLPKPIAELAPEASGETGDQDDEPFSPEFEPAEPDSDDDTDSASLTKDEPNEAVDSHKEMKESQENVAESISKLEASNEEPKTIQKDDKLVSSPIAEATTLPKLEPGTTEIPDVKPSDDIKPKPVLESESKLDEQISEQKPMEEQPAPIDESDTKPENLSDEAAPPDVSDKKSKKSRVFDETTPLAIRASSRISTRSTRKESATKKDDEEDRKSKTTPVKAKPEPKSVKKTKGRSSSVKSEEESETPVVPKSTKKTGKGRKKWGRGSKAAAAKATPKSGTDGSADENSEDDDETPTKKDTADVEPKAKTPSKSSAKKEAKKSDDEDEDDSNDKPEPEKKPEKIPKTTPVKKKRGWLNEIDVSNIETNTGAVTGIRQSRRIAQLKIKEQAESKYVEHVTPTKKSAKAEAKSKQQASVKKNNKSSAKKTSKSKAIKEDSDGDDSNYERSFSKKKRKKKDLKKKFKAGDPWKAGSDSSSEEEAEEDDHFEEDEEEEENVLNDASDHEFSPESDLEDEDFEPVKRARTAHSKPKTEDKSERDDLCCQKCRTAELPEWILLCDKCDEGWHAACLRPPLMTIPEGDWFCPPCQHNMLIVNLHKYLKTYDRSVKKRENEELRRKRMEYVGISTSNIIADFASLPKTVDETKSAKKSELAENESAGSSEDEEESEGDEPLYTLRVRRQANVSYRLNEYDELMNSAIQRETNEEEAEVKEPVPAPPPEVIPNEEEKVPEKVEPEETVQPEEKQEEDESSSSEEDDDDESKEEKVSPVVPPLFRNIRKKPARLTKLDVSSDDDHYSDEDFKGSSGEDYDEDEYAKSETDSDEARYRKSMREPVRRSTRARVTRYDNDFINDDDSEEDDYEPKKKKKKSKNSDSDSEEEDSTWGKRKRSKYSRVHRSSSKKKRRRIVFDGDTDEEKERKEKKGKKSRITYGLEADEDDYPQRRTRGKKINYLENLGSDSDADEDTTKSKSRKVISDDDDDDYVNDDDGGDNKSKKNQGNASVCENGDKNDTSGGKSTADPTSLHELIATNNTGVIRTYSKSSNANQKCKPELSAVDGNEPAVPEKASLIGANMATESTPQIYQTATSAVVLEENKMAPRESTNPSLEGMQSMAQSIQMISPAPSTYSMARKVMPDGQYIGGAPPYADVGISYEDPDVIAGAGPDPTRNMRVMDGHGPPVGPPMGVRPPGAYMPMPGPMPMMQRGPMPPQIPMHMRGPVPPPMPPTMPPMNQGANQMMEMGETPTKKRARGKGKKQLEMERLERMKLAGSPVDPNANTNRPEDQMMPLHMLKPMSGPDMNQVRPPAGAFNSSSPPSFAGYPPNMARLPYSTAAPSPTTQGAVTVSVGNPSKRVKITPTRMRMPAVNATPPNVMRFPRAPGMLHSPHLPMDPSPSGGIAVPIGNADAASPPAPGTGSETDAKKAPIASPSPGAEQPPQQYYPPSYPPPSQISRGFNQRPEFAFVQKPMQQPQPPMYQPPVRPPPGGKPEATPVSAPSTFPPPGPYAMNAPPPQAPVSSPTSKANATPTVTSAPPVTSTPPAYQALHIKQLPPTQPSTVPPSAAYNAPYYVASPVVVPNSYAPRPQPPLPVTSAYGAPPMGFPPPVRIPATQPTSFVKSPPQNAPVYVAASPASASVADTSTTNSSEYQGPQPERFQFQACTVPITAAPGSEDAEQFQPAYEEPPAAAADEQSTGEFGGLVSYFSSQREDDLDA